MVFWGYLLAPADRTSASSFTHFENHFKFSFENSPRFETGVTRVFLQFTQTKALIPTCNDRKIQPILIFQKHLDSIKSLQKGFQYKTFNVFPESHYYKIMRSGTITPSPCHGLLKNLKNIKPQL